MSAAALNALYRASLAPGATVDSLRDLIRAQLQHDAFEKYAQALEKRRARLTWADGCAEGADGSYRIIAGHVAGYHACATVGLSPRRSDAVLVGQFRTMSEATAACERHERKVSANCDGRTL